MSGTDAPAFRAFNYELLDELRRFWFEHVEDASLRVLPDMSVMKRFFMGGDEFDGLCVKKFAPALEEIKSLNITKASDLLAALPPRGPLDWLAMLLLLDQVPRNSYRGAASGPVFTFFDPLALGIALETLDRQIFTKSPVLRWNFTYRLWNTLPLIHSESLEIHDRIERDIFSTYQADTEALIAGSAEGDDGSEERKQAVEVFRKRAEEGQALLNSQREQEEKHVVILRRFGRYPHRNGPMGREMTTEEQAYLDEGGDTFAPPKTDEEKAKWDAARKAEAERSASGK